MKQASCWFIIVTYYPKLEQLGRLLKAISPWPVVAVSNTPQVDKVNKNSKSYYGKANLIRNKTNLGYGGGANVGIRYALGKGAQWVVVLNQDLVASSLAIKHFVTVLGRCPPGIAGPFAGGLDSRRWTTILPSSRADYITGSCIAIHRDVYDQVGFFHEPYFLYYEEVDLCIRAKRAGFPLMRIPICGIIHEESVTLGRGSFLHQYYLSRNHLLFVARCAPWQVRLRESLRLPKTLWQHWWRGETGALKGIWDYMKRHLGALE